MRRINDCQECGQCRERCPYKLDTPTLLRKMLADYEKAVAAGEPVGQLTL
jgi:predicted aldo/keto reductase-like oxidoreductase